MKPLRVRAVARKEFLHIIRDPRSLGMGIAIPMLLLILFGYALSLDVDRVPLLVWDQDNSPASRDYLSHFQGSPYFEINEHVTSYREIDQAINSAGGRTYMALVIPADFAARLGSARPPAVQVLVDGSDANTAEIAMGYAQALTGNYRQKIGLETSRRLGGAPPAGTVEQQPRVWFNQDLESRNYIIPGLIAVIMMVIAALLTSLTIAREWETGTMEQLLSTPLKVEELLLGKLLPYFAIGMVDVLLAVLMGELLFDVPLRGSLFLLFGMAAIFLAGSLALGMLISILTRSQLLASQVAMVLTFLPAFLLSGFMYDIANMPRPVQLITHLVPARYFVSLLQGIYLKGVGLEVLAFEAALLTVFAVAMLTIARLRFRKKLV
jgi:ABC-2 type transport system permease protein